MKKYGGVISRVIIDYEIYRSISVVAMTTPETKELQNVRKSSGKVTANFLFFDFNRNNFSSQRISAETVNVSFDKISH